jgi:hypothetical protein
MSLFTILAVRRLRRYHWVREAADKGAKWALIVAVPICLVGIVLGYALQ